MKSDSTNDPTHNAWLQTVRPAAERAVSEAWRESHRFAVLSTSPKRLDKKGRRVRNAEPETKASRLNAFDDLRRRVTDGLASNELTVSDARKLIAESQFAGEVLVAASQDEAARLFSELLANGDNAWCDGECGPVLWLTSWRE